MYYSRYYPDSGALHNATREYMQVEVSTNGGGAWTSLIGPNIDVDQGIGTDFQEYTYDMSAYINVPNLRIRIRYFAEDWYDGAAVDDIQLFGTRPLSTSFDWISALPVDAFQDLACTIPYTTGTPAVTVYVKPTLAQLEQATYTFTASAILSNGCSVSDDVSINNKSKVWKGTSSNDWNNANNWSPIGVPDITNCVIIPDVSATNYSNIGGVNYDAFGKTLQVLDDGDLQLRSGNTLTIEDFVEVEPTGIFHIENSGSLIQINNVANTGDITMDRNAVTNSYLDYVYWSTPVAGFTVNNITPSSNHRYYWIPTVANGGTYAGDFGNWTTASGAMTTGRGYIIRGSSGISTFSGVPNNGNITTPISRSDYNSGPYTGPTSTIVTNDDDNWNLLGNPYPSAISATDFLVANTTNLEQLVKIWLHGIDPSAANADPFYQNYIYNYSLSDYLTYNAFGPSVPGFNGYIGAGQGFFTLMRHTSPTMNSTAVFNNSMRSNTYRNDQFFRTNNESTTQPEAIEKHRIWMKLIAPNGSSSDALVGYASGATNGLDDRFDAISGGIKATFEIYSLLNNKEYAIQARSLPFDNQDQIPLGIVVSQNGLHTIALTQVDGLFLENQNIYLEDLELGIIHDIKAAPYTFGANNGRYNNRFVLRFTNSTLSSDNFEHNNNIFVYTNEAINVSSQLDKIEEVTIFDTLGRVLYSNNNVNNNSLSVQSLIKSNSALIVKAKLDSGITKSVKIIF